MKRKKSGAPFKGSLVSRVLSIFTLFLILPLLCYTFFLYWEDLQIKKRNNLEILAILAKKRGQIFASQIADERELLSLLALTFPEIKKEGKNDFLSRVAKQEKEGAIFHLSRSTTQLYLCDFSSNSSFIGKDFSSLFLLHPEVLKKGGVVLGEDFYFYLVQPSFYPEDKGVFITLLSSKALAKKIGLDQGLFHDTSTFLLSSQGEVILSTGPKIPFLKIPSGKGSVECEIEGRTYVAVKMNIEGSDLEVVVAALKEINFVDIPYFFIKMLLLFLLILIVGGGSAFLLIFKMSKPLKQLLLAMRRVGKGDLNATYQEDQMGFEINTIGEIFNQMAFSLKEKMEEIQREKMEKGLLEKELMIGQEVQKSLLPKEIPLFPELEIGTHFLAAKEVSGDFYDFFLKEGKHSLLIVIADAAGKGISACLYSLTLRSLLRSCGAMYDNMEEIVREANRLFCFDTGDAGEFVTAWIALYLGEKRELFFSNCGHHPPLLLRKEGGIEKLSTEGTALGIFPEITISVASVELRKGDLLFLYTDGVIEAPNLRMEMFGERRMLAYLETHRSLPSREIALGLVGEVLLYSQGAPQHDDIAAVVIKL